MSQSPKFVTDKISDIIPELKDRTNWDPPKRNQSPFEQIGKKDEFPLNQMHERWLCNRDEKEYGNGWPMYGYDQIFYMYKCHQRQPVEIQTHKEFCIGGPDECGSKLILKCARTEDNKWTCE